MLIVYLIVFALLAGVIAIAIAWRAMIWMPGRSWRGPLKPLTDEERALSAEMRKDNEMLSSTIGERNLSHTPGKFFEAADFLEGALRETGLTVHRESFQAAGKTVWNVVAEPAGFSPSSNFIIIGAHYDTVPGSPGANDNGSACVALLALARRMHTPGVRFVCFANEEMPYSTTPESGSVQHARECASRGEKVAGMISLETIGCFFDEPRTQKYPPPLSWCYPSTGDFIAFVGNYKSRAFVHRTISAFRDNAWFPSEGIAATELIPDIGRSDHRPFWREGIPALMVTDTANFRYHQYHRPDDTFEKIDYDRLARVVSGLLGAFNTSEKN